MIHLYSALFFMASLAWVFYFSQRYAGMGRKDAGVAFTAGVLSAPVAGVVSYFLQTGFLGDKLLADEFHLYQFILYFFIVGPAEEGIKFLAFFLVVIRNLRIKKTHEVILLGMATALGFAGAENILYLYAYGWQLTLPRLLLGNLGHAGYAVFWAYGMGAHLTENAPYHLIWAGLLAASVLHGVYNYFLSFSYSYAVVSFLLFAGVTFFMFHFLRVEVHRR